FHVRQHINPKKHKKLFPIKYYEGRLKGNDCYGWYVIFNKNGELLDSQGARIWFYTTSTMVQEVKRRISSYEPRFHRKWPYYMFVIVKYSTQVGEATIDKIYVVR
ncbi:MAG: hypothetical protein ACTSUO_00105, partial [Candidatus Thorarchaeota archaeon]